MAMYEKWFEQDLQKPIAVRMLTGNLFSMDNEGNKIGVRVFDGGEAATLSGTVSGNVIRQDGGTVSFEGTLENGNEAYIVLPQAACAVPGIVTITIKITSSGVVTTLAAMTAVVYRTSTDTAIDPGTIIPDITTLISAINTAVASIPADYSSLWATLAPNFSSSTAYVAGQYVTYNGAMYRFTTDHAAGSWNSAHVVSVNIGAELSALKSALSGRTYIDGEFAIRNLLDYGEPKEFEINATGAADNRYYWGVTFKEDCEAVELLPDMSAEADGYVCSWKRYTNNTNSVLVTTDTLEMIDSGTYKKGATLPVLNVKKGESIIFETSSVKVKQLSASAEANGYINIVGIKLSNNSIEIPDSYQLGGTVVIYTKDNTISDDFNEVKETVETIDELYDTIGFVPAHLSPNIFNKNDSDILEGKFITYQGVETENSSYCESGYIPVTSGDILRCIYNGAFLTNGGIPVNYYSSDKTRVNGTGVTLNNIVIPSGNIAYIRIALMNTWRDSIVITKNDTNLYPYIPYGSEVEASCELEKRVEDIENNAGLNQWEGKNCVCIGDSIMWYDGHELGSTGVIAVGYPSYLHNILGLTVNNQGISGACVAYHEERQPVDNVITVDSVNFANYDLVVLEGGINDFITGSPLGQITSGSFDKTTFYGAYQYIIEKILTDNPTIQIVIFLPYKIAWGTAGTLPLSDYIEAIKKIADRYAIPIIDMYNKSGFNVKTYGANNVPGTYTIDGLHANNAGYKRLCDILISELRNLGGISQQTNP